MSIRKGTSIIAGNIGQNIDNALSLISENPVQNKVVTETFTKTINHSYITNCITKVPQDIILDLTGNVLTLKAGSKIYYPNGFDGAARVFDSYVLENDIIINMGASSWVNEPHTIFISNSGIDNIAYDYQDVFSGDNAPTPSGQYALWYDTGNNIIRRTANSGATWTDIPYSLPICTAINTGGHCDSVTEIFNGMGYVGGHFFRLPGLSGLAPNGKNEDGTYINEEWTLSSVMLSGQATAAGTYNLLAGNTGMRHQSDATWFVQDSRPTVTTTHAGWYDTLSNKIYYTNDQGVTWTQYLVTLLGKETTDTTRITRFQFEGLVNINNSSRANSISDLLDVMYPIGGLYIGTQNTCPMTVLMPGTTWSLVSSGKALWTGTGSNANTTINAGLPNITGSFVRTAWVRSGSGASLTVSGAFGHADDRDCDCDGGDGGANSYGTVNFNASWSNNIYGASNTVQPPAYVVNVWRRTA